MDRRTPLTRSAPLPGSSPGRAAQLRRYATQRVIYLAEHPYCAICMHRATDVHHKAGRIGALLLDETRWLPLCRPCHVRVTTQPAWAVEHGYSQSRLGPLE